MIQAKNHVFKTRVIPAILLGITISCGLQYVPIWHDSIKQYAQSSIETTYGSARISPIYEAKITALAKEMGIETPIIMRKMNTTTLVLFGYYNAFAIFPQIGNVLPLVNTPFLFISEGFFEDLSEQEQRFLIGHELAHIKAEHTRYLGITSLIAYLMLLFLYWQFIMRPLMPYLQNLIAPSYHYWLKGGTIASALFICSTVVNLASWRYQRHIEWEADIVSLTQLQSHDGGLKLMERWQRDYQMAATNRYWGLCADHPSCTERKNFIIEHQKTLI
jgi:Zn-dependent protease with chaperone function